MAEARLQVFPSRMVLQSIKERLGAARTGWDLLKRKSESIKVNLNAILKKILITKRRVGVALKDSAFSHTEAQWAADDFNSIVIENTKDANYRVKTRINNVAGVKLPVFDRAAVTVGGQKEILVGLSKGGQAVNKCRDSFTKTLDDLIQLASLQTSLKTLDEALKVTNRRVNALEFVVMPRLQNTIKYIISELDELEREDQFRIKKVKDNRSRDEELERAAEQKEREEIAERLHDIELKEEEKHPGTMAEKEKKQAKHKNKNMIQQEKLAVDSLLD